MYIYIKYMYICIKYICVYIYKCNVQFGITIVNTTIAKAVKPESFNNFKAVEYN